MFAAGKRAPVWSTSLRTYLSVPVNRKPSGNLLPCRPHGKRLDESAGQPYRARVGNVAFRRCRVYATFRPILLCHQLNQLTVHYLGIPADSGQAAHHHASLSNDCDASVCGNSAESLTVNVRAQTIITAERHYRAVEITDLCDPSGLVQDTSPSRESGRALMTTACPKICTREPVTCDTCTTLPSLPTNNYLPASQRISSFQVFFQG
jgi:hypothetical protein